MQITQVVVDPKNGKLAKNASAQFLIIYYTVNYILLYKKYKPSFLDIFDLKK